MQRRLSHAVASFAVVFALAVMALAAAPARAGELTSRMRTVAGSYESNGYHIVPVDDAYIQDMPEDLMPAQAYELVRPDMNRSLTIGRLFTSCSCIRLEAEKRTFGPGERAILILRNIRATPKEGQLYAFFVQTREPLETTVRFDTFIQTGVGFGDNTPAAGGPATSAEYPQPAVAAPGQNNQLAAALSAVGTAADGAVADVIEATGDIVNGSDEAGSEAGEAADEPAEEVADAEATADLAADLGAGLPDLPAFDAPPAPAAAVSETEAAAEESAAEGSVAEEPAAAALSEDLVLQMQQLALVQAEEQAKQLARRVQDLPPAPVAAAPAAGGAASGAADLSTRTVSLITIGVRDMPASIRFYEALGWRRAARGKYDQTAFFQLNGQILALYPLAALLAEQNMEGGVEPAPGGITLALHVKDKDDVVEIYQRFIDAGGRSLRAPAEMASGAVSSYVADPDGNPWEISWVPQFTLDATGDLWLP